MISGFRPLCWNREEHSVSNGKARNASPSGRDCQELRRPYELHHKKHLPRRTFLRGLGVTMSLPLLDSMIPAQTPLAKTAANPQIRSGCASSRTAR